MRKEGLEIVQHSPHVSVGLIARLDRSHGFEGLQVDADEVDAGEHEGALVGLVDGEHTLHSVVVAILREGNVSVLFQIIT